MPDYTDPFILTVRASAAASVSTSNYTVGSGETFALEFHYAGGFNPVATGFRIAWYGSETDQDNETNALSPGEGAPTQVTISPFRPEAGAIENSPGEIRGIAPTLNTPTETSRAIYAKLTILQGALRTS